MEHLTGQYTLNIGGKNRTLFFDYTFVSILQGLVPDGDFEGFINQNPMLMMTYLTYAGLLNGDDVNDLPEGFSIRVTSRWLFAVPAETQAAILEAYKTAMGFIEATFTAFAKTAVSVAEAKPVKGTVKAKQG